MCYKLRGNLIWVKFKILNFWIFYYCVVLLLYVVYGVYFLEMVSDKWRILYSIG